MVGDLSCICIYTDTHTDIDTDIHTNIHTYMYYAVVISQCKHLLLCHFLLPSCHGVVSVPIVRTAVCIFAGFPLIITAVYVISKATSPTANVG